MSSRTQAEEVLKRLPAGNVAGVEVGVYRCKMSMALKERQGLTLFMVDNWLPFRHVGADEQEANYMTARSLGVAMRMDSVKAAEAFSDGSLDFVFIDADHSYDGVCRDIEAWYPKVKDGGLLCGHDYANKGDPCGMEVKRAVDELAVKLGKSVELGKDSTWFYR